MFDMSWGEVMLIGGVALIVIGPKDLPKALRTVGQITGKMRRMAGEFQSQFNEAIREAEFDEIRREVDGVKRSASTMGPTFNPVQTIRDELKGAVDGRVETKTTPSPAQGLANVADRLAERDNTIQAPPAHDAHAAGPVESLPDLPPRPVPDAPAPATHAWTAEPPVAPADPIPTASPRPETPAKPQLDSGR
ncbi:preprotein translocase subunit TatA [Methylobacterium sp. Leaf104]|uniref:Sec-independent protein translocase protein TatB n=1 Tax=Methylobacterium TaxID=407 RepID=UPI0006FE171F|nr:MULTISPECIES: Sec-independent protein translocase protein TatB [Methylobacterium]KQP41382.1 preprotein translocase subunit TatA [Methylobacterium sp. Leaf104]MCI9881649.1 twin-arginine translocase subunit TatB [Methylobacterium goesingense]